jgi:hypothetical protein
MSVGINKSWHDDSTRKINPLRIGRHNYSFSFSDFGDSAVLDDDHS